MNAAKILSSQRVYSGRFLEIDQEELELPNGARASLEIIRHPGASAVVPVRPDGTVVLIRQWRQAAGGWIFEVPAGKLDPAESPQTCALRETIEETGVCAGRLHDLGMILTTPGFTDEKIWLFAATALTAGEQALEEDEALEVVELPLTEALEMVANGSITDGKTICTLLRLDQELRAGRISLD